jgi:energy-coupling factor transport system ATP-binding protein
MKVAVENLHFTYPGGIEALCGVSFSIEAMEKVAIIGQNGAGKTTLVKHFNGLLKPNAGRVVVGDWDTRDVTVARLASRVGYLFQNPDDQLFMRTVFQEIAFGPTNLGFPEEKLEALVQEALLLTGLEDQENTHPYDLSSTWRKMVAMASIIAMDTPILILDEPTTGQDANNVARIGNIIEFLNKRGKTLILITHDIDFAAEYFDRIIIMGQGKVLLDRPVKEAITAVDTLASTYVEPPQLTRLGFRLGLPEVIRNQEDFLRVYPDWRRAVSLDTGE